MRNTVKARYGHVSVLALVLTVCCALPAYGEDATKAPDDWEVRLMPYIWMPSLKADSTVNGLSGTVDLTFGEVLDNLDSAAMGRVELWKDKWGLLFDGTFMNLGASDTFTGRRGLVNFSLDADVRLGMTDFALARRILDQRFGNDNEQRFKVEPYGGLRYAYLKQEMDLNVTIAGVGTTGATLGKSEDWVEPFIGTRLVWDLNDKLSLNIRGDAGGFGIGSASDLIWQIAGGVDYKISKSVILNAGYKYVDVDYSRGNGRDGFGIDLQAQGPYVGLTFLF